MRFDVQRQLFARSDRVKGIDFHPQEPWVLTTLYSGHATIWSYETQSVVKTFEVTDVPVRAGRFIARKSWFVVGSDDFMLRVYNYNTSEKIAAFEAHPDYVRSIAVHPTQPFVLTASDDMTIKLWDWEKGWKCVQTFEGHSHYVMSLAINPKDTNTFASACLDRTVKIWSIGGGGSANFTLEAHESKGVNHVDYYHGADKPYIVTTSDDRTIKIWDYTTKALIATLEGHTSNVSFACFHPEMPVIVSGSEDGTVKVWHSNTYRLEQTLSYGLERAWCVSYQRGKNAIAVGFDEGCVVVRMGREEPAVSMDPSGKIVWAKHNEVLSAAIKPSDVAAAKDSEPLTLSTKDLGSCEIYPQSLLHSPNGRFVSVCGDGEYIIYTALAWRNKAFGKALDFVWANSNNDYAIRESSTSVKLFKNFKEQEGGLDVGFAADGLMGGMLLGVRGQGTVGLYDWETGGLVRRIDVVPNHIYWSDSGELVTLACDESFYVLKFSREAYQEALAEDAIEEDGVEAALEVVVEISETVRTGQWIGDCFIYTNSTNRLNYLVGDQTQLIAHFDQPMYLLGYIPRDGRIYVADKDVAVSSYALSLSVLEYQTVVLRGDMDAAAELLETSVPADQKNKIARFLEGQGYTELALSVATDPDHRFDLALALGNLDIALEIVRGAADPAATTAAPDPRWKTIGDAALAAWNLILAEECFRAADDLGSLLLLHTATGSGAGLRELAAAAQAKGANNVAFACLWQTADVDACVDLLLKTHRPVEAALLAHTYKPSAAPAAVKAWKASLDKEGKAKIAEAVAVPGEDEELFPQWGEYLRLEEMGGEDADLIDVAEAEGAPEEKAEEAPAEEAKEEAAAEE